MGDAPGMTEELWLAGCPKDITAEDVKAMLKIVELLRQRPVPKSGPSATGDV